MEASDKLRIWAHLFFECIRPAVKVQLLGACLFATHFVECVRHFVSVDEVLVFSRAAAVSTTRLL